MQRLGTRIRLAVIAASVVAAALIVFAARDRAEASGRVASQSTAQAVATVATLTTRDFRLAVVAQRSGRGAMPTADVRLAVATRVGSSWRERGEMRLRGTYFWHTVSGPRSICRLQIATAAGQASFRPSVIVQLLRSPALGCGDVHRFPLPTR